MVNKVKGKFLRIPKVFFLTFVAVFIVLLSFLVQTLLVKFQVFSQSTGLIAAYSFDNINDPLKDYSGNNYHLTCTAGANCPMHTSTGGHNSSGAYDFSAAGKYLTIPQEGPFDFDKQMTVSFWMKNNTFDNSWEAMVVKGASSWGVTRYYSSKNVAFATLSNGAWAFSAPSSTIDNNAWHHIAVTYNGTSKKVFIDGIQKSSNSYSRSINKNNAFVTLGFNLESPNDDYTGFLDDVRIYSRALSLSEIQYDMNNPVSSIAAPTQTPVPTPVITNNPTSSPVPTVIPTPTRSPSPVPTATNIPTVTPSSTPVSVVKGQKAYTSQAAQRQYLLYVPNSYGQDPNKKWPLIIFMHGLGVAGSNINNVKYEALPQMLEQKSDFEFLVLSPLVSGSSSNQEDFWTTEKVANSMDILINEIQTKYSIDSKRLYLTGYSLGGGGTWGLGLRWSNRFAALVPVAGFYNVPPSYTPSVPANLCDLKNTWIKGYHGQLDSFVPISAQQNLINKLTGECAGTKAELVIYPSGHHDDVSAPTYYNNTSLYNWMLTKSLP